MARKIPAPLRPPEQVHRQRSDGDEDELPPLPDATQSPHYQHLGAIPRSPSAYPSPPPFPQDQLQTRRRLNSLNLDTAVAGRHLLDGLTDELLPHECLSDVSSQEVTALEGQELYLHFFHEQLRSSGLGDYALQGEATLLQYHDDSAHIRQRSEAEARSSRPSRPMSLNLQNFQVPFEHIPAVHCLISPLLAQNPIWRETGRELQSLADEFARSNERVMVRQRAEQVDIASLDREKFLALLKELFDGGRITRERILVLFFFCSDVAIRAVRCQSPGLLVSLTQWSLLFIRERICAWVHHHGGWSNVLRTGLNLIQQTAIISMCAAVIATCLIYIRKNC